jgi:heme iron utilization protein
VNTPDRQTEKTSVRKLLAEARTATLSVLDSEGTPYGTLVNVGHDQSGKPLLLISEMARHTKFLRQNGKASLLIATPLPETGDPLTAMRITVTGHMTATEAPGLRAAYLAEHPYAETYVDFGDFGFWTMTVKELFLVGGFGRIHAFTAAEIFPEA